jgi:nucleoside-triphosphatase THEP1
MKIGYICSSGSGDIDLVLETFSKSLAAKGVKACGIVQINSNHAGSHRCDMDVCVLPDGPVIRISQSLGKEAKGCRLDPAALEAAVLEVETRLTRKPDILIINKFGKHEANGRGFRGPISTALSLNIPIVVGVNQLNLESFQEFCGEMADPVDSTVLALKTWFKQIEVPTAP